MKYLFLIIAIILSLAALGTYYSAPDTTSKVPVIYWVTDRNPARELQVKKFHEWCIENGHVGEDGQPRVELRLDMANRDKTKQIIQSVSGVGSDIMDLGGGSNLRLFQQMNVLKDVTEAGKELGFDPSKTYAAVEPLITVDGRQYMFPCNVTVRGVWVNTDVFKAVGMEPPPTRWTIEQFDRMGQEFNKIANPPGTRADQRRFFCDDISETLLYRSMGLSLFNETATRCTLNDPRYVRTLTLRHKWIYIDNFMPTPDDTDAFATEQGYGGAKLALFGTGNYAMVTGGRYYLIRFRDYNNLGQMRVVEPPYDHFPNTTISTRAAVVYQGSDYPHLANLFQAYLASENYNALIVEDADALPPNPAYTRSDSFLRPEKHPNEWGAHGQFVKMAEEIAIGEVLSPFVLGDVVWREVKFYREDFYAGQITAEEAAKRTAERIDFEIDNELKRKPHLQEKFDRRMALQKKIDALKAAGKKIPRAWVSNTFYLRYYAAQGMLTDEVPASLEREGE